jgi:exopolyphosphatase / guanosine-5'-triphosphate,3'-diphosphate pyrophosphatase
MSSKESTELVQSVSENCFAALDIGSHTTRMLIARKSGNQLAPVRTERRVTRLAQDFQEADAITEKAQRRNISAIKEYAAILRKYGAARIACGATGVVRRAKNCGAVLDRIAAETGIDCNILSEETEAVLSAKGILSALPERGNDLLTFDVGGGSTEFVLTGIDTAITNASRPVGAATLTEAHLKTDPPGAEAVQRAALSARSEIISAKEQLYDNLNNTGIISILGLRLIGTAGTVSTLAAMYIGMERYVPYRVNGVVLTKEWLSRTIESLAQMPLAQRRLIAGLEPGREEIILGGAVIVSEILSCFGRERFDVSDAGLLEGLLIELVEKQPGLSASGGACLRTGLTWRLQKG